MSRGGWKPPLRFLRSVLLIHRNYLEDYADSAN
jgi:hypothetical protein